MIALLLRDLRLAIRAGGGFGLGLAFFLIVTVLVPFGVGPEGGTLAKIAPGILWVGALLACLLSLDRIFALDFEDGSLDLLATAPIPLEAVVTMKAAAHWLTTGLPLVVAAPVFGVLLNLQGEGFFWLTPARTASKRVSERSPTASARSSGRGLGPSLPASVAQRSRPIPGAEPIFWISACGTASAIESIREIKVLSIFSASQMILRSKPSSRMVRAKFAFSMKLRSLRAAFSCPCAITRSRSDSSRTIALTGCPIRRSAATRRRP